MAKPDKCMAVIVTGSDGYVCQLPRGHKGVHVDGNESWVEMDNGAKVVLKSDSTKDAHPLRSSVTWKREIIGEWIPHTTHFTSPV